MRKSALILVAAALFAGSTGVYAGTGGTITVPVGGIQNDNGVVRCGLFSSADTFRQPGAQMKGSIARISGGSATCKFTGVPAGTYAVAVFHAENNESMIRTGMFGKPKEGYGFSKNAGGSFGPPSFGEASVAFNGSSATWPVHLRY
jgi:uncharacterized protein (DUF2141 family)